MPPTGADMPLEFSTIAEKTSTTIFSLSDTPVPSTPLRTPGELHGARRDSSDWLLETPVVSAMISHLGSPDLLTPSKYTNNYPIIIRNVVAPLRKLPPTFIDRSFSSAEIACTPQSPGSARHSLFEREAY